ncbi:hypothetical protein BGX28_008662 [Mortierella sp. GBA30]|nr:hypothetical protein BGX28_008662 [Mortierella sp. GBA30]
MDLEDEDGQKMRLLSCRATNPMHIPEIRSNVAKFLTRKELRSCLLVCEDWWETFAPLLYTDIRPVYQNVLGSKHEYPPTKIIKKNSHLIKSFEYNGHGTVLLAMLPPENRQGAQGGHGGQGGQGGQGDGYKDEVLEWRKTEEEEAVEENWGYMDEDAEVGEGEISMRPNESLSEFEERVEMRRIERELRLSKFKEIQAANRHRNETSRYLNDNTDYRSRFCDHLERLILTDRRFSRERGCYYKYWIKLMQINQHRLRAVELHYAVRSFEAYRDFFNQVVSLQRLTELTIVDNDIDPQKTKPFLETICVRLHKLELRNVRIEFGTPMAVQTIHNANASESQIKPMEKMKSLTLFQVHARSASFPMDFIKSCPNLVELNFRPQWGLIIKDFSDVLADKVTGITYLTFKAPGMSDMDASQIIKSVPKLEKLDLSGSVFGLMATNNLMTRHAFSISYLDIRGCNQVTGSMIQRVLGECRHLLSFMADHIKAKDVVNNSVYQNWACIGLRELIMDFRGDSRDRKTSLALYRQLGKLTCLEHLDISRTRSSPASNSATSNSNQSTQNNFHNIHHHNTSSNGTFLRQSISVMQAGDNEQYSNCLTLDLDSGLKELGTLVHLNRFIYRGLVHCDVGLVELQWMAKAWPRLEYIGGKLKEKKMARFNPNVLPGNDLNMNVNIGRQGNASAETSSDTATLSSGDDVTSAASLQGVSTTATAGSSSSSSPPSSIPSSTTANVSVSANVGVNATSDSATSAPTRTQSGSAQGNQARPRRTQIARIKREVPANLMAITLFRLKLHHRIKVVSHPEDKPSREQQRQIMHLFGEYSDDEQERLRPGQLDPRYRPDFRWN